MRCKTCNNTESFKHKYAAEITESVDFCNPTTLYPLIMPDESYYLETNDLRETYWCVKCLSDDIDMEGYEG